MTTRVFDVDSISTGLSDPQSVIPGVRYPESAGTGGMDSDSSVAPGLLYVEERHGFGPDDV